MFNLIQQRIESLIKIKNKINIKMEIPVFDIKESDGDIILEQVGTIFDPIEVSDAWNKIKFYNHILSCKIKLYLNRDIIIQTKVGCIKLSGIRLNELLNSDSFTLDYWLLKKLQVQLKMESSNFTLYSLI